MLGLLIGGDRLINQQHEVCVTFATFGKRKNMRAEVTIFFFEKLCTETETSREHVEVDAAHLSGAKAPVNHRTVLKRLDNLLSHSTEKLVRGYFRKSLVFLKVSGAAHLRVRRFW